ncbi:unnamed protein product [Protopolystoma xenopodis]|uniref:Uncharacterized protein n=1 Tax=Protopolystoma xenopodis TaxID=117903 RepID=A0A448XK71_9PLAT|nr:unnamed protein product [Protopolystoma xenopodis]
MSDVKTGTVETFESAYIAAWIACLFTLCTLCLLYWLTLLADRLQRPQRSYHLHCLSHRPHHVNSCHGACLLAESTAYRHGNPRRKHPLLVVNSHGAHQPEVDKDGHFCCESGQPEADCIHQMRSVSKALGGFCQQHDNHHHHHHHHQNRICCDHYLSDSKDDRVKWTSTDGLIHHHTHDMHVGQDDKKSGQRAGSVLDPMPLFHLQDCVESGVAQRDTAC